MDIKKNEFLYSLLLQKHQELNSQRLCLANKLVENLENRNAGMPHTASILPSLEYKQWQGVGEQQEAVERCLNMLFDNESFHPEEAKVVKLTA